MGSGDRGVSEENVGKKFVAAWQVFSTTCSDAVAPEATFQAWFAHYLISQFGIDRVAREPDFQVRDASPTWSTLVGGSTVQVDAVVTRRPGIYLPRRAALPDRSAVSRLSDLAVISELKVASTQGAGLGHTEVMRDFWKLSMLLDAADRRGIVAPLAFMCILDNHAQRPYRFAHLDHRLQREGYDSRIVRLQHPAPPADSK